MNRTLIGIGLTLALVVFLGVLLVSYLALGSGGDVERTLVGENLSGAGSIAIGSGYTIDAADETDAYYMLGYAHGIERPWTLNLLRQTALGRLGEWFGDEVLPIDRLTRSLAVATGAREALDGMSEDDRRMLRSYARGVTDAFKSRKVVMDEQLVLFDILPEPWEAWHSIALERLFAWLSEPPERPSADDTAFAALRAFQMADESLRAWLHLHGFDHSSAWAYDDSSGTTVQAQYVYGASSLPFLEPARLTWADASVNGASLLGTPFFPFSSGKGGVNVTLLSSPRSLKNRFAAGYPDSVDSVKQQHERLVLASGAEKLLTVHGLDDFLFFGSDSFKEGKDVDHLWGSLEWHGLAPISDWPSWRSRMLESAGLSNGAEPPFRLINGVGLSVNAAGDKTVEARPVVSERGASSSVFVAIHPIGRYAAQRFREQIAAHEYTTLPNDVTSVWAETNLHKALAALRPDSVYSPAVREAIDYLRNWDFRYNLASIGATVFDAWMGAFTDYNDPFPVIEIPGDSLGRVMTTIRLESALSRTVDSLTSVAGPDPARWRLESFRTSERYFPVWSFAPLANELPSVDPLRYAPLSVQQPGHPTTIAWESGLFDYPFSSPAHVVARANLTGSPDFSFNPDYKIGSGIIARHVVSPPGAQPDPFPSEEESVHITFLPAR